MSDLSCCTYELFSVNWAKFQVKDFCVFGKVEATLCYILVCHEFYKSCFVNYKALDLNGICKSVFSSQMCAQSLYFFIAARIAQVAW